jgi:acetyl-CoA carboxylase carboxyltransferase component
MDRMRSRGKLPIRERIANVLDPDSPFLEISPLAGYGSDYTLGGGMVVGVGVIAGAECVVMGNDPSVLGGALTPYALKKWMRAIEIARDNRIPYVSFVESAGADLRVEPGSRGGGGERQRRAQTTHFAETGRSFYEMIELSKLGVPTVCVVFGSSTAGGAYQPGLSDYVIVVKEQSKVFLAGPPLVKMATGEVSDDETLGGARLHAEVSGLGDYFAEDEMDAIRMCREVVSHLNLRKPGPPPVDRVEPPAYDPEELLGVVSRDLRQPVDVRDVVARVVDGSRFEEFKPRYGSTMVCGWAAIHGYPVGILGNNGVIYTEGAEKAAHFIQLCNQVDVPLLFLQNVTGYMVGRDYEAAGIVKKGSQMINAVTNSTVPHLTVIIGSSYGAGTYGMSGRAFDNRFTFLWPTAKIAVMGPKQIAGVMSQVRRGQAERKGLPFDEEEDAKIVEAVEAIQEKGSLALVATGAISDDGIIDPRDTRDVLGMCLSVVRNRAIEGAAGYGVFRL